MVARIQKYAEMCRNCLPVDVACTPSIPYKYFTICRVNQAWLKDNSGKIPTFVSYFLHLKADGGLHLIHLVHHVVRVSEESGELAGLAQARTQQPWDLLDETV